MEEQSVPIVIHLPAFHVEIIVGAVISVLLLITIIVLFKVRIKDILCLITFFWFVQIVSPTFFCYFSSGNRSRKC